jgi:hypothetical protein
MKIRIGSKVRMNFTSTARDFCRTGDIFTVCKIVNTYGSSYYKMKERIEQWPEHGFDESLFEVISQYSEPPKTELEWLDRVQENFKE